VHIDDGGYIQHRLPQYLPECAGYDYVGGKTDKFRSAFADFFGLQHGNIVRKRKLFHGAFGKALTASALLVWLGYHTNDRMARIQQPFQTGHRELRSSKKRYFHICIIQRKQKIKNCYFGAEAAAETGAGAEAWVAANADAVGGKHNLT
jgi:hypothetical protein